MADEKTTVQGRNWKLVSVVLGAALIAALALLGLDWWFSEPDESAPPTTVSGATETTLEGLITDHLGIVVDNAPSAWPLVGIVDVPVIVEYPVEGGMTRFVAIVPAGSGGLVGPVRSLRPVNADLLPVFASAVVSSGGQPFVTQEVTAAGITPVTPDIGFGFVSMGRPAPHDVFLDLDDLSEVFVPETEAVGLPSGDLSVSSETATEVGLPYPGVTFIYEEGSGYLRRQDGAPFEVMTRDGTSPVPLAHDTLVVLSAAERAAGYSDSNGVPVADFDVIGGGDLTVFHEGSVVRGTWSRTALADGYVFRDGDGTSFGIPEGRVYLAIVPRTSDVSAD